MQTPSTAKSRIGRATSWFAAWLSAPMWPPSRRRYWNERRTADATRSIVESIRGTFTGLEDDRRLGAPRPSPHTVAMAGDVPRGAAILGDPTLVAAAGTWRASFDVVIRAWPFADDATMAIDDLRAAGSRIQVRLGDLIQARSDAESDVIASYPVRTVRVDRRALPVRDGRLELYRYRSIRLWRLAGRLDGDLPPAIQVGTLVDVDVEAAGDVAIEGHALLRVQQDGEVAATDSRDLSLLGTPQYVMRLSGAAGQAAARARALGLIVLAPLILGVLLGVVGGWRYRAAFEAGVVGTVGLVGTLAAVVALEVIRGKPGVAAALSRAPVRLRHPRLWFGGAVVMAIVGLTWMTRDVADWLAPPDRLVVTIQSVFGPHYRQTSMDIVTDAGGTYSTPMFIQLAASPGPAAVYLGHVTHHLLRIEQPPGSGVDPTAPPAATAAPAPSSLPATPAYAQVLLMPRQSEVFGVPSAVGAYWYRSGSSLAVALTGLDPRTVGQECIVTTLLVDNQQLDLSQSPTASGACGGDGVVFGDVLRCGADQEGWLLVQTAIPAGETGMLVVQIQDASGAVYGLALVQGAGPSTPGIDIASMGCHGAP